MLQEVSDKVCIHELYITSHRKFSKKDLYYFALSFGFSVATLLSSGVRVYIQPLDQYISNRDHEDFWQDLDGLWG